ncbi:hypothetical protein DFA_09389 [Cavenderia fasciculata]|uniref:Uncharacterized protein n=1 Tax=Cavenderia fasciculata TaxID=261658 RepID=F4Q7H6_CACFS|nr:uncharacterized protein DFA_09389 [Cavenderia fasciculata]EGG16358.1 hypothetical protein DFA_09389 [Cavenderia fasciculata]|eukprot:XP_004354742.1 hypothetical protein DFA_09389 [Cavenderia fasciculata]
MSKFSMLLNLIEESNPNQHIAQQHHHYTTTSQPTNLTASSSTSSPSLLNHKRVMGYDDEDVIRFQQQQQELIKSPKKTKYNDEFQQQSHHQQQQHHHHHHHHHSSPTNSPPLLLTKSQIIPTSKQLYTPEYISSKVNSELVGSADHTCPSPSSPPSLEYLHYYKFNGISPNSSSHHNHHSHGHQQLLTKSKSFETTEQQVATVDDNYIDHEEIDDGEFGEEYDDDYDDEDEEGEEFRLDNININNNSAGAHQNHHHHHYASHHQQPHHNHHQLQSLFEEMKQHGSSSNGAGSSTSPKKLQIVAPSPVGSPLASPLGSPQRFRCVPGSSSSTPSTPKSHVGTPSRPFPTLDYKVKSEQVKQNTDGTYSCPYPTCNKTIKGNKGNLSSHLRWHRRLDAEAGESRGINNLEEGEEEEFTTPLKPSQRGVQLRNQMIHYGLNLFRQDNQGKYLCFFDGCQLRMLTNFSRHIAKHERKGDQIKEELKPFLPKSSVNNPRIPCSPPPLASLQNTPCLYSSQSTPNLSPLQDSIKSGGLNMSSSSSTQPIALQPALKSKKSYQNLTVNVNNSSTKCGSPIGSSHGVNSISVISPPLLSPTFGNNKPISSPPFEGSNNHHSSSSSPFVCRKSLSTSKLEIFSKASIEDDYNQVPISSSGKRYLSQSQTGTNSPTTVGTGPSSPNFLFSASSSSSAKRGGGDEIQWIYKKPVTPSSSPRVSVPSPFPSPSASVVPTTPPSPNSNGMQHLVAPLTPTSSMNIQFSKLHCGGPISSLGSISNSLSYSSNSILKPKKEDAAKSLICFKHSN